TVRVKGIHSYARDTFPQPGEETPVRDILSFQIGLEATNLSVAEAAVTLGGPVRLSATLTDASSSAPIADQPVTFFLGGNSIGTATTDANGVATLAGVSTAGYDVGTYAGEIRALFSGDAGALHASGAAA